MQWTELGGLAGWAGWVSTAVLAVMNHRLLKKKQSLEERSAAFVEVEKLNKMQAGMIEQLQKTVDHQQLIIDRVVKEVDTLKGQQNSDRQRISQLEGEHTGCKEALDYAKKQGTQLMNFLKEIHAGKTLPSNPDGIVG